MSYDERIKMNVYLHLPDEFVHIILYETKY